MTVTLVLMVIMADSLPPLPDLSQVIFPEPQLWIEKTPRKVELTGYGGEFHGASGTIQLKRFLCTGSYEERNDWILTRQGNAYLSYSIPLSGLFIKPSVNSMLLHRHEQYELVTPALDITACSPWTITSLRSQIDLWRINGLYYPEYTTLIDIIFDRVIYIPHININALYSGKKLRPILTGNLHIKNLHLAIGSPLSADFPSPEFKLKYLIPQLKITAGFKVGAVVQTLKQKFDPMFPFKYRLSIPEESLKTGINVDFELDVYDHIFHISGAYNDWGKKRVPLQDYSIGELLDVKEYDIELSAASYVVYKNVQLQNFLHINYFWLDTVLAFVPQYSICDTFDLQIGYLTCTVATEHIPKRTGLGQELPSYFVISPSFGLTYGYFKIFASVLNAMSEKGLIFDDYRFQGRKYAGGAAFKCRF